MKTRFEILDIFRGICAICVVIFHLHFANGFSEEIFFRNAGGPFVLFFFILSGFVMTYKYNTSNFNFKTFMLTRFFRIFPLHIFVLCAIIIFELLFLFFNAIGIMQYDAFVGNKAPSGIIPTALLIETLTTFTDSQSFNGPAWSLSAEFYTYVIFALICLFLVQKKFRIFMFIVCILLSHYLLNINFPILDFQFLSCIKYFFCGSFTFVIYDFLKDKIRFKYYTFIILEILCILGIILSVTYNKTSFIIPSFCATIFVFAISSYLLHQTSMNTNAYVSNNGGGGGQIVLKIKKMIL